MTAHELARILLAGPDWCLNFVLTDIDGGIYEAPVERVSPKYDLEVVDLEGDEP